MANPFPFTSGDVLSASDLNSIGEWTTYTPGIYGLTLGNGTLTAKYARVNDLVFFNISFVMGSTSAVTGGVGFSLPVTRLDVGNSGANGFYANTGTSYNTPASCDMYSSFVNVRVLYTAGTYVGVTNITATVPFTWATNDPINVAGFYEAA